MITWKTNSKYLAGFRKILNTQNSISRMIEYWKAKLNSGSRDGVIIMDLSKHFGCLNRDLLSAKLEAYGLDNNAVSFMRSYLTNRSQHCKGTLSTRVPQGSILGPLLFHIFINDIFLFLPKCDLANYAGRSTMYTSDKCVSTIKDSLTHEFIIPSKWFYNNFMVLNLDKC